MHVPVATIGPSLQASLCFPDISELISFFQRFFSEFLFLNKHLHIFTIWAASDPKKPCQRALRYAKTVPTLAAYAEVADSVLIMVRWPEFLSF